VMCSISEKWWSGSFVRSVVKLCVMLATFSAAHAQVVQRDRYELLLGELEQPFQVAPAQQDGIFLYRGFEGAESNALQLIFLDTAFRERWSGFIAIEKPMVESKVCYANNALFVLLRFRDFSRNDMQIVDINKEKGTYVIHSFRNFIPLQITSFQVTRKGAIIGGYFNRIPVVLFYSFEEKRSKLLPGLFNEAGELTQVRTYTDDSFDVLVSALNYQRQQTIIIRNYDATGDLIKSISLKPDEKKNLIFGQSIKTFEDTQIVAGVYGARRSEFSKGIFMANIDPVGNDVLKYYTYGDLQNFFKYMRARREQRVKERIARRKIKGRKLRFNYRFIVHEIVPYKDQYIMLGEAFYPRYVYTDRSYGSFFGSGYAMPRNGMMMQNGRVFDGYYYTHAVVIGFDQNGKLLWDNSFEINDVRTFELEQFVKLDVRPDHITLLYLYDHQIRSKIINDNEVLEGKSIDPIKLKFETDQTKKGGTEKSRLDYWYDHNFYAYGVQTVTSTEGLAPFKRRVFFINKITHP
jgi:hypothetical protein